ncbi:MAG: ABC transporter substrate-binding protein [Flammeovirgaceae bacterium]
MLFAAGMLVACNNQQASQNEQTTTNNAPQKKVFRYNQSEGLSSLDPAFARNQANIRAQAQIYNALFEFTSDLSEHPCLAETWEESPNGKVYTINIRKGVYFHDSEVFPDGKGREVTAEDFVFSFKRLIDPSLASPGAAIFYDKVLRDKNSKTGISDTCFVASNKYQLKIYLENPFPPFLQILAMPFTVVIPKEAVEKYGADFGRKPVGTGPFIFKEWDEGNSLILLKNNNYWRKDPEHNPLPYLDAIQISFIPDKNQEFLTFSKGGLEFISGIDASTIDQILKKDGTVREEIASKFVVQKVPYISTEYIGFQLDPAKYEDKNHPFLNKKVRQAMSYAINREEVVSFLRNNLGKPAFNGFVPSALPSFDDGKVKGYNYDPDKAKKLLKEAGFGDSKKMPEITLNTTPQRKELAELLQKQWSQTLGIKVNIEINNFAAHQDMMVKSSIKFFSGSWIADYPDEENFLSCFYSKNVTPNGFNYTGFKNAEFDKIYEKVHQEKDGFKRHEIYHKLDQMVMDECAVIVLYYDEVLRLHQKGVINLPPSRMNNLNLERVDMTQIATEAVANQ